MMRTILIILVIHLLIPGTKNSFGSGECVGRIDNGYLFLKSYPVRASQSGYTEASYVLTKGTGYVFILCPDKPFTKLELFDSNRNKVFSLTDASFLQRNIEFKCQATGIYYFRCTGGEGELVLGFKR